MSSHSRYYDLPYDDFGFNFNSDPLGLPEGPTPQTAGCEDYLTYIPPVEDDTTEAPPGDTAVPSDLPSLDLLNDIPAHPLPPWTTSTSQITPFDDNGACTAESSQVQPPSRQWEHFISAADIALLSDDVAHEHDSRISEESFTSVRPYSFDDALYEYEVPDGEGYYFQEPPAGLSTSAYIPSQSQSQAYESVISIADNVALNSDPALQVTSLYGTQGELDAMLSTNSHEFHPCHREVYNPVDTASAATSTNIDSATWELGQTYSSCPPPSLLFNQPPNQLGNTSPSTPLLSSLTPLTFPTLAPSVSSADLTSPSVPASSSTALPSSVSLPSSNPISASVPSPASPEVPSHPDITLEQEKPTARRKRKLTKTDSKREMKCQRTPRRRIRMGRKPYRSDHYIQDSNGQCLFCGHSLSDNRPDRVLDHAWTHVSKELTEYDPNFHRSGIATFITSKEILDFVDRCIPECPQCNWKPVCFRTDSIGRHFDTHQIAKGKSVKTYTLKDRIDKRDYIAFMTSKAGYHNVTDYLLYNILKPEKE